MTTSQLSSIFECKPRDCVGCGYCCSTALCSAAQRLYGSVAAPCPALKWDGERNNCALMQIEGELGRSYRESLYAGEGCCSGLNSWRQEPIIDRSAQPVSDTSILKNPVPSLLQMFMVSLGKQFVSGDMLTLTLMDFNRQMQASGYSEQEALNIIETCSRVFKSRRMTFLDEFCG